MDKVIIRKQDRIDFIFSGVCDYYKVPKDDFRRHFRNPTKVIRKKILMTVLYDVADCSYKDISNALGLSSKSIPGLCRHVQTLREDMSFDKGLKAEYTNVLKHLGL
jgi:chromosomal replication initiation ATPase DnaA